MVKDKQIDGHEIWQIIRGHIAGAMSMHPGGCPDVEHQNVAPNRRASGVAYLCAKELQAAGVPVTIPSDIEAVMNPPKAAVVSPVESVEPDKSIPKIVFENTAGKIGGVLKQGFKKILGLEEAAAQPESQKSGE
jgi:hypothetical protein